jgi:hypothetical protein
MVSVARLLKGPDAELANVPNEIIDGEYVPLLAQYRDRSTSMNPSFAARRIERTLAVWVASTTVSPGSAPANQSSAAAHASAAYPRPHASGRNR